MTGVAAPGPVTRRSHHTRTNRIEVNVTADLQQILVSIDENALETPLKKVPGLVVPPIVGLGIDAVDLAHQLREVGATRLENEVIVVVHQAVRKGRGIEAIERL